MYRCPDPPLAPSRAGLRPARTKSLRQRVCAVGLTSLIVLVAALHAPTAAAQPFPGPQPQPCAGPNVVPSAVQALADEVAAATRAIDARRGGAWRAVRDLAEAACRAGDRATLDAVLERCIRECADEGDRYLARIDYAAALVRFGDPSAAEVHYREAIVMRPGRPPDAIEAYNNYALLLQRQGRPLEALDVLNRFSQEELRSFSFPAMLKLWVMRELGMDTAAEQAAVLTPFAAPVVGARVGALPFPPMPGTPNERPVEPLVVEIREDVTVAPRARSGEAPERGQLHFTRMSTPNRIARPPEFTLAKGERIVVVAALGGDACRIEHAGNYYDLVLCPWLRDAGDRQRDFYRVRPRATPPPPVLPAFVQPPVAVQPQPFAPPSEWEIWRRFYDELERFGRAAPEYPQEVLEGRAGLSRAQAEAVRAAGREYLERLTAIDEAARAEIAARFSAPQPFAPPLPPTRAGAGDARPPVLVPGRTPDGRSVQAILAEEGFGARLDAEKQALQAAHRARLAELVDSGMLQRLEAVVRGEALLAAPPPLPKDGEIIVH